MPKIKLIIEESSCRSGYHKAGDVHIVDDLCPCICHELWNSIYPNVFALKNGAILDFGTEKAKRFSSYCPDNNKVLISGHVIED